MDVRFEFKLKGDFELKQKISNIIYDKILLMAEEERKINKNKNVSDQNFDDRYWEISLSDKKERYLEHNPTYDDKGNLIKNKNGILIKEKIQCYFLKLEHLHLYLRTYSDEEVISVTSAYDIFRYILFSDKFLDWFESFMKENKDIIYDPSCVDDNFVLYANYSNYDDFFNEVLINNIRGIIYFEINDDLRFHDDLRSEMKKELRKIGVLKEDGTLYTRGLKFGNKIYQVILDFKKKNNE